MPGRDYRTNYRDSPPPPLKVRLTQLRNHKIFIEGTRGVGEARVKEGLIKNGITDARRKQ